MWKAIEGTNGMIEVNENGQIRSLLRGEPYVLKSSKNPKGYHCINITVDGVKKSYKVHREVAKAFISNPDNLPQVNHKDGNKDNNNVLNLEWVSNKQNAHHAIKNGLWKTVFEGAKRENESRKKPIIGYSENGEKRKFASVSEAEKFLNSRHISDVLKGKRNHVKGWYFRYESEVMPHDDQTRSAE